MLDFMTWILLSERNEVDGKPFATSLEALKYIYDNHPRPDDLVVTFQSVDKVGINPSPKYSDTPLGIYFYTAEYVLGEESLPYAPNAPYMFVCELTRPERIVHIRSKSDRGHQEWMAARKQALADFFDSPKKTKIAKWGRVARDMGISGFIDHGTGTIYDEEPSQGVVFTASDLRVLHRLDNSGRNYRDMPRYDKMGRYIIGTVPNEWLSGMGRGIGRAMSEADEASGGSLR